MARVIAVANQKGGVGKTTTAVNVTASLAHLGQSCLLIDLDPQANATSGLGVPKDIDKHIYHVLLQDMPLEDVLRETTIEYLDVAPSHLDLYGVEMELMQAPEREKRLLIALEKFHKTYDYIFIDCPPALNLLTLNAFSAANSVLIPMPCEYYSLEGLSMLVNTIERMRGGLNPGLELEGVLINMFDGRSNLAQQVFKEIKDYFNEHVYETVIPRNVRVAEAPGFGKPVLLHDPHSTGAQSFLTLAREFLQRQGVGLDVSIDLAVQTNGDKLEVTGPDNAGGPVSPN